MNNDPIAQDFETHRTTINLSSARIGAWLVVILMPIGSTLEIVLHPEHFLKFLLLRVATSTAGLIVLWFSYQEQARRHAFWVGLAPPMLAALTIEYMVTQTGWHKSGYYAGINLCILGFGVAFYWKRHEAILGCFSAVLLWVIPSISKITADGFPVFYNNLFFLILTSIIVVIFTQSRYRLAKSEFEEKSTLRKAAARSREIDKAKNTFFANISHELRTPLTLSMGPVRQLIARAENRREAEAECAGTGDLADLQMLWRNQQRLLKLVDELLELAKLESAAVRLEVRPTPLRAYLEGLVEPVRSAMLAKGLLFRLDFPEEDVEVHIDAAKFDRVVLNLLANAFKFTDSGGRVTMRVQRQSRHRVRIAIEDTGIGIAADKLHTIFERFAQAQPEGRQDRGGVGVGLALAREYTELHNGSIEVQSTEGDGTVFSIELPLGTRHFGPEVRVHSKPAVVSEKPPRAESELWATPLPASVQPRAELGNASLVATSFETRPDSVPPPATKADRKQASRLQMSNTAQRRLAFETRKAAAQRERLLVVDDTADMRQYLRSLLQDDYDVLTACSGLEGIEVARGKVPALVLSDVMMEHASAGEKLCAALRREPDPLGRVPIVLMTARANEDHKLRGLQLGADDYLFKPFNPAELKLRLRNLLHQRQQERALYHAHRRLDDDLATAREFQRGLLPDLDFGRVLDGAAVFRPYDAIGGDFYDMSPLGSDGSRRLLLADATGHGVDAALISTVVVGEYRRLKLTAETPAELFGMLNRSVTRHYQNRVTGSMVVCDLLPQPEGIVRARYSQAGHAAALVHRAGGSIERLLQPGLILGLLAEARYAEAEMLLNPGDRLFLFTDGLEEQKNVEGVFFQDSCLMSSLACTAVESQVGRAVESLMDRFDEHSLGVEQGDDITLLAIEVRRTP